LNKRTRFANLAKSFRDHDGLPEINPRQEDHELVPSLSPENPVTTSDRLFERPRKAPESDVSGFVPVPVIKVSKGIDIAHQRRDRSPGALCFRKGIRGEGVER
jgi:hypothetical protein